MPQNSKIRQKINLKGKKKDYKRLNISICNPLLILKFNLSRLLIFLITIHQQNLNKLAEALNTIYLI